MAEIQTYSRLRSHYTIQELSEASHSRSVKWFKDGEDSWTILEWAGAMCGEAGETANVAKKIRRLQMQMSSIHPDLGQDRMEDLRSKLGEEMADTLAYLLIMAQVAGIDLEEAYVLKFNKVSRQYGFPERLEPNFPG